ncbi:MAG: DUF2752 domain-containing protein [Planctomycetota bacterium]
MCDNQEGNFGKSRRRLSAGRRAGAGIVFIGVFFVLLFFWAAAKGRIDVKRFIYPCGFKQRFDLPCPSCGMTTSIFAFMQGRIFESFYIQPAAGFFCIVLSVTAVTAFLIAVSGVDFGLIDRVLSAVKIQHIILGILVVLAGGWAVTLARALAEAGK